MFSVCFFFLDGIFKRCSVILSSVQRSSLAKKFRSNSLKNEG